MTRGVPERAIPVDRAVATVACVLAMPFDGPPSTYIEAVLHEQGFPIYEVFGEDGVTHARNVDLEGLSFETACDVVSHFVANVTASAMSEDELIESFDVLLSKGFIGDLTPIASAMKHSPVATHAANTAMVRDGKRSGPKSEVNDLFVEALSLQYEVISILEKLIGDSAAPNDIVETVYASRRQSPLGYLANFPEVISRLMLSSDRGSIAALAAAHFDSHPPDVRSAWHFTVCARLWRDGTLATLRLIASVHPEMVSEDIVSAHDRLDIPKLVAERLEENAWLSNL